MRERIEAAAVGEGEPGRTPRPGAPEGTPEIPGIPQPEPELPGRTAGGAELPAEPIGAEVPGLGGPELPAPGPEEHPSVDPGAASQPIRYE